MTLYYDPKTKKTKIWTIIFIIILPIVLTVLGFLITKKMAKQNVVAEEERVDIFEKI